MGMALQLHQEHHHRRPLGKPANPIGDSKSFLAEEVLHQPEELSVGMWEQAKHHCHVTHNITCTKSHEAFTTETGTTYR
jgi:hypothetical protein